MEKTSVDWFNEHAELEKKTNEHIDQLDQIEREKALLENERDKSHTEFKVKIRAKEDEIRNWRRAIRMNRQLSREAERQGWNCKQSGT
jgi:predicted nuclease with TOPRIM domain